MNDKKQENSSSAVMESLQRLVGVVELQAVRFVQLSAKTNFPAHRPCGSSGELTNLLGWEAHTVPTELPNSLVVQTTGHFGIVEDPKQNAEPQAEVHLTLELVYKLPSEAQVSDEAKTRFAQINGVFNAWPFFRAKLFSLLPEMGLPPYTLPVYRVPGGVAIPTEKELAAPSQDRGEQQEERRSP
jgi:hypothetical protein